MKGFQQIVSLILTINIVSSGFAQEKSSFPEYNIDIVYQKLRKEYPFISPIKSFKSKEIKSKENIVYKKAISSKLKLDVYAPKGDCKKTYPTVLLIHGGGWLLGSKENQRIMAQHLALNNYIGISVAYRLGFEAPYPAGVIDLKDAIRWIRKNAKKYQINPDKIAVLGASAGGQLATLIGVTPNSLIYGTDTSVSDEVQAIVNIDGIVSFIHPEASSEGKMAAIWLSGTKEENFKNWTEASPLEYVKAQTPPILFINSSKPRFHAGRDAMIKLLSKYNIYTEMQTIPDSPHSFWLVHPWFEITLNYTVAFLQKVFKE